MATIKTFSDLEQSRKLAEILPPESADLVYYKYANRPHKNDLDSPTIFKNNNEWYWIDIYDKTPCGKDDIMAWSLAALLNVIPGGQVNRMANSDKWEASSWNDSDYEPVYYVEDYDNPIDACYELLLKLNELNLL